MEIVTRPIDQLLPYARNARTHSDAQVAQVAASIVEFGWTNPVLVDGKNGIIAGHGRVLAARKLGIMEVPVIELSHLTETQKRAYIIADNKLALNAGWDEELLRIEMDALREADFNLDVVGFDNEELDTLFTEDAETNADVASQNVPEEDAVETPKNPVSQSGDIWIIGKHRLLCGDSTKEKDVLQVMDGDKAALCFSSPPYGNQRDYTQQISSWDELMRGVYQQMQYAMRDDGQILVNLGLIHKDKEVFPYWETWIEWMRTQGWRRFAWYVWHQGAGMPGDWCGRFAPCFEFVFHFNKTPRKPNKIVPCKYAGEVCHELKEANRGGLRNKDGSKGAWGHSGAATQDFKIPDSVISIPRQAGSIGDGIDHPAVFPVAFPEYIMQAFTNKKDICFEPFCGSGSSLLAAERCGRIARAIEIAPEYVDVTLIRFSRAYPDIAITLESNGKSYAEVREERLGENIHD